METLKLLLVDDNPDDRTLVIHEMQREFPGLVVHQIYQPDALEAALKELDFDLVITDYRLNWSDGLEVLRQVRAVLPDCPVIMFTGTGNQEIAVQALKSGLDDYVIKSPKHFKRLPAAVRAAMKRHRKGVREAGYPASDLHGPDIAAIARGFGAAAETIGP